MLVFCAPRCTNVCRQNTARKRVDSDPTTQRRASGAFHSESSSFWTSTVTRQGKKGFKNCSFLDAAMLKLHSDHDKASMLQLLVKAEWSFCLLSRSMYVLKHFRPYRGLSENRHYTTKATLHILQLDTVRNLDWAIATSPVCPSS